MFGWFGLRREAHLHGRGFWIRPLLLELALGAALAALYWWEVERLGLIARASWRARSHRHFGRCTCSSSATRCCFCWMLAASFIDIDEKIIPDEITVTGTLLGLALATVVPMSLLPHVAERPAPPVVGDS